MIDNYFKYLIFLNNKLQGFFQKQKPYIKCFKGCDKCCKNAEFPYSKMEFKYLLCGFLSLDKEIQDKIEYNISKTVEAKKKFKGTKFLYDCPFLIDGCCSVYKFRGIVCRTFGLITNVKDGKSKIPFCAYHGLNYSNVLDKEKSILSSEIFKTLNIDIEPLGFNISYDSLTNEYYEKKFNFKFGEKLPLIDWFLEDNKEKKELN